jgi:hypothetical protein
MEPLDELLAYVRKTYEPLGIVVGGSILRGEGGPNSDYDVFVIHDQPWRQRVQRFLGDVPAELFVNPPAAVRGYLQSEHAAARPVCAHLLSTGQIVEPSAPVVHELVAEAKQWLAKPPPPFDEQPARYRVVDILDDARDVHGLDPATELLLLMEAVGLLVEFVFRSHGQHLPRRKSRLERMAELDPVAADRVRQLPQVSEGSRLGLVEELVRDVLGVDSFFPWSSPRDPVTGL